MIGATTAVVSWATPSERAEQICAVGAASRPERLHRSAAGSVTRLTHLPRHIFNRQECVDHHLYSRSRFGPVASTRVTLSSPSASVVHATVARLPCTPQNSVPLGA